MTLNEINDRINRAVEGIEPPRPTYICPGRSFRCPYMGGSTPCPDSPSMCRLAREWLRKHNQEGIIDFS